MKKIRIVFIILTIIWMAVVFKFSNEPADKSTNTSSAVIQKIVKIIYGDTLSKEELELKVGELQPIVRKLAHYSLYATGGALICLTISTYEFSIRKRLILSQIIGSIYSITDEIHQYFIPRKELRNKGHAYRLFRGIYRNNIYIAFD